MRKLAILLGAFLLTPALAYAQTCPFGQTLTAGTFCSISDYTVGGAIADTDSLSLCQTNGNCHATSPTVTYTQKTFGTLATYLLGKFSGTAPITFSSGAIGLAIDSTLSVVGGQLHVVSGGGGSVTNVATGTGLTGGPITTTGTISCVNFGSSIVGCVPASGGGTTNFLRADGAWAAPGGGGGSPGGSNTQVQYNNSGSFAGTSGITTSATKLTSMSVGLGSDGTGDIYYNSGGGTFARLGAGTAGQILQMSSGLPSWQTVATGSGTVNNSSVGQIPVYTGVSVVTGSPNITFASGLLTLDTNTNLAIPTISPVTPTFTMATTDTNPTRIGLVSFGSANAGGVFAGAVGGTAASPSAVTSGTQLSAYHAAGYDGTNLTASGNLRFVANQNFSSTTNHGTYAELLTTPNASATPVSRIRFEADGGITVPSTVTGGDQGVGTINASGLFVNGVAVSTGGGGGITSFNLAPGFTSIVGTQNLGSGAQSVINATGQTVNAQLTPVPKATNYTVLTTDTGNSLYPSAAGVTFTAPNPASGTKGASYQFGSDGTNAYVVTTTGGTAAFYGCPIANSVSFGTTSLSVPANTTLLILDDGTNYQCTMAGTPRPTHLALTWLAGVNPNGAIIDTYAGAGTHFIRGVTGTLGTAEGSAATVTVRVTPSGTACSGGTNVATGTFNANGPANTTQTLTLTTASGVNIPANSYLCMTTSTALAVSSGSITVTVD